MAAEGHVARGLSRSQTLTGLEPLAALVDEADQRDRGVEDLLSQARDAIKAFFRLGIEDVQGA